MTFESSRAYRDSCRQKISGCSRNEEFLGFACRNCGWTCSITRVSRSQESLFGSSQEIVQHPQEPFWLFDMRHVRAVLKDHPFRPRNAALNGFHDGWGSLIIAARQEQHLVVNPAEAIHDAPVPDRPNTMELAGSVHGVIDLRILVHFCEAAIDAIRPHIQPAEVSSIKDHHSFLVLGIARGAS